MRVGIDVDGTITRLPWFFHLITEALVAKGHKVHIITYRPPELKEYTVKQLRLWRIKYDKLHISDQKLLAPEWKRNVVKEEQIDLMIEDDVDVLLALPKGVKGMLVVGAREDDEDDA